MPRSKAACRTEQGVSPATGWKEQLCHSIARQVLAAAPLKNCKNQCSASDDNQSTSPASSGVVPKTAFLENAMRDLSTTLCRGITRHVLAKVPLRARLNGRPVVAGLPVPADDIVPVAGGPS